MGSWLPWRKLASNPPGLDWPALPADLMPGCGVDQAYQRYLTERYGLAVDGGTAPDWDELRNTKPDIAAAWADAANAVTSR